MRRNSRVTNVTARLTQCCRFAAIAEGIFVAATRVGRTCAGTFRESVPPGTTVCADALARVGNVANNPTAKELIMLAKLTMLSATALLAGGMSIAAAQS